MYSIGTRIEIVDVNDNYHMRGLEIGDRGWVILEPREHDVAVMFDKELPYGLSFSPHRSDNAQIAQMIDNGIMRDGELILNRSIHVDFNCIKPCRLAQAIQWIE